MVSIISDCYLFFFFCKESDTEHLRLRTLHSLLQFLSSVITTESNHRHRMGGSHSNETFSEHGLELYTLFVLCEILFFLFLFAFNYLKT